MNPTNTKINCFGPHTEHSQDWPTRGVTAIVGAIGTGKTFLLEADFACLYGFAPSRAHVALYDCATGENQTTLETTFKHRGIEYHAIRELDLNNRTQKAWLANSDKVIAGPKVRDFDAAVTELIGDASTALATWFSAQNSNGDITRMSAAERRTLFGKLLKFDRMNATSEAAGAKAKEIETEARIVEAKIGDVDALTARLDSTLERKAQVEAALENHREQKTSLAAQLSTAREKLAEIERERTEQRANVRRRKELTEQISGMQAKRESLKSQLADWERCAQVSDDLQTRANNLSAAKLAVEKTEELEREYHKKANEYAAKHAHAKGEVNRLEAEFERLEARAKAKPETPADADVCATCPLMKEWAGLSDHMGSIGFALDQAESHLAALGNPPTNPVANLPELREVYQQSLNARNRIEKAAHYAERVEVAKADIQGLTQDLDRLASELKATPELSAGIEKAAEQARVEISDFESDMRAVDKAIEVAAREEGELHNAAKELKRRIKESADSRKEKSELDAKIKRLRQLQHIFGPRGAQPLLIDAAAPEIEKHANQRLAQLMPGHRLRIATTQRNQDGSERETFALMVMTPDLNERDVSTFSGGEQAILRAVIRLALMDWQGSGAHSLRMDEPFDGLDAEAADKLLRALEDATRRHGAIVINSHSDQVVERISNRVELVQHSSGFARMILDRAYNVEFETVEVSE